MGGSGSSGQQQSNQQPLFGSLNPLGAILGQGFGLQSQVNQAGGFNFTPGQQIPQILSSGSLNSFLTNTVNPESRLDTRSLTQANQGSLDVLQEAQDTGLVGDSVALSRRLFEEEFIPTLSEQFGSQLGIGPGDSDFGAALAREGGRRSNELAALAQDRRLEAAGQMPGAIADTLGLQQGFRSESQAQDPTSQIIANLGRIAGLNTQSLAGSLGSSLGGQSATGVQLK